MGKNIKFRPFVAKMAVDDTGRRMTISGAKAEQMLNAQTQEELQVQVQHLDKGNTMVWSLPQFEEKFCMMKDALAAYEEKKAREAAEIETKTVAATVAMEQD